MAEPRPTRGRLQVHVNYLFDRLHDSKLAQAYSILVPVRERPVGGHLPFGHGFERNGDFSPIGGKLLLGREHGTGCLEEDRLIASGGIRLEPRHSPKRAVV